MDSKNQKVFPYSFRHISQIFTVVHLGFERSQGEIMRCLHLESAVALSQQGSTMSCIFPFSVLILILITSQTTDSRVPGLSTGIRHMHTREDKKCII